MKILWKKTDCKSLEISQENFYDEASVSKITNLQCSVPNFTKTHSNFTLLTTNSLWNMYRKLILKIIKREKVFFLRKKTMMDQHLNKVGALQYTIPSFIKKVELM